MINSLFIKNFQSHKSTSLEFHPGVNVIVGSSDSGKTAIIRALRWLVWNRPSGDEFCSTWGGGTNVTVYMSGAGDEELIVEREKATNVNMYCLGLTEFNAFKTEVPQEIQQALNINEINLQQQLDSPFLLSETAGEVAQHFNKVAHLDAIDSALRNINSWLRTVEQQASGDEHQLQLQQTELTQYDYLDKFETQVEVLEQDQQKLIQQINSKRALQTLLTTLDSTNATLLSYDHVLSLESPLNSILSLQSEVSVKHRERIILRTAIQDIEYLEQDIEQTSLILSAEPAVDSLLTLLKEKQELEKSRNDLSQTILVLSTFSNRLKQWEDSTVSLEEEFTAQMPAVCPLCGK